MREISNFYTFKITICHFLQLLGHLVSLAKNDRSSGVLFYIFKQIIDVTSECFRAPSAIDSYEAFFSHRISWKQDKNHCLRYEDDLCAYSTFSTYLKFVYTRELSYSLNIFVISLFNAYFRSNRMISILQNINLRLWATVILQKITRSILLVCYVSFWSM